MNYLCVVVALFGFIDSSVAYNCQGCLKDGQCMNLGYKYEDRSTCAVYECKRQFAMNGTIYQFGLSTLGCQDFKGGCVSNGTIVERNCYKFLCRAVRMGTWWSKRLLPYQESCMDFYKKCIAPGSKTRFVAKINNKFYLGCECRSSPRGPHTLC